MNLSKLRETVKDREAWYTLQSMELQRLRHDLVTEQQHPSLSCVPFLI